MGWLVVILAATQLRWCDLCLGVDVLFYWVQVFFFSLNFFLLFPWKRTDPASQTVGIQCHNWVLLGTIFFLNQTQTMLSSIGYPSDRIVRKGSINKHGKHWKDVDILVFNTLSMVTKFAGWRRTRTLRRRGSFSLACHLFMEIKDAHYTSEHHPTYSQAIAKMHTHRSTRSNGAPWFQSSWQTLLAMHADCVHWCLPGLQMLKRLIDVIVIGGKDACTVVHYHLYYNHFI